MLNELMAAMKTAPQTEDDTAQRDRERRRLSARQLRAEMREHARMERALMEIGWSRLC
ncbi:hypothetical protein O4J56_05375 [Nocardiopsis sp. RSe5-2]|uniref:Uncharacterized protein n=1 Tax=Nocardiopsis endophytica TaxID=3018445 RepID=A0ABT4TZD5_9ACTN|nr:hypothetical protein [Nocardiopsis endophytica]MDA2810062.1 hypothetical protein [Nocardiopsis endophytica]